MLIKIHNTEVVTARIPGDMFYELKKRAEARHISVNDYVKNALAKYMEYKPKGETDNA